MCSKNYIRCTARCCCTLGRDPRVRPHERIRFSHVSKFAVFIQIAINTYISYIHTISYNTRIRSYVLHIPKIAGDYDVPWLWWSQFLELRSRCVDQRNPCADCQICFQSYHRLLQEARRHVLEFWMWVDSCLHVQCLGTSLLCSGRDDALMHTGMVCRISSRKSCSTLIEIFGDVAIRACFFEIYTHCINYCMLSILPFLAFDLTHIHIRLSQLFFAAPWNVSVSPSTSAHLALSKAIWIVWIVPETSATITTTSWYFVLRSPMVQSNEGHISGMPSATSGSSRSK